MPPKKKKPLKKKKKATKKIFVPPITSKDLELPRLHSPDAKTSALHKVVVTGDTTTLARLVVHYNYQENLIKRDINGSTPVHIAVKQNDLPTLIKLLDLMSKTNNPSEIKATIDARECKSIGGHAAIHYACKQNNVNILKVLLQSNADPNINSESDIGDTPLHLSCRLGIISCAKILLEYGANVNAKDGFGHNPSYWAYANNHNDMIKQLNLPPGKCATSTEFLQNLLQKNKYFQLPKIPVKTSKKKSKDKKK